MLHLKSSYAHRLNNYCVVTSKTTIIVVFILHSSYSFAFFFFFFIDVCYANEKLHFASQHYTAYTAGVQTQTPRAFSFHVFAVELCDPFKFLQQKSSCVLRVRHDNVLATTNTQRVYVYKK